MNGEDKRIDGIMQYEPYKMQFIKDRGIVPFHYGKIPKEKELLILISGMAHFLESLTPEEKQLLNNGELTLEHLVNGPIKDNQN